MAHQKTYRFRSAAVFRLAAWVSLLLLLCAAFFLLQPMICAQYMFRKYEKLQLGSSFEDAQRLAQKIDARPYGPCDRSACEWNARVGNSRVPRWWRGSGETFFVYFEVKNSIVVRKGTDYATGIETDRFFPSAVTLEEQRDWGRMPRHEPIAFGWGPSELYRYYRFGIYMTPNASPEDRRRFTSFNFNCFWKYKGCKDARELLPAADRTPMPYGY